MDDFGGRAQGTDAGYALAGARPLSPIAGAKQVSRVITAMNLIRMNIEMYPPGHARIAESVDHAFNMIQKILRVKTELLIGFAGDTLRFGETAPDTDKQNAAFRDYARCLNNLHIVSFSLHRGLKKEDLTAFNRIIASKPADIWALGKIETVFADAGVRGIMVKAIEADQFKQGGKNGILPPRADWKAKNEDFWQELFTRLKSEVSKRNQDDGIPTDQEKVDTLEVIRFLNKQRAHWSSAVFSYEKMIENYYYEIREGRQISPEKLGALTSVSSLVSDLNPELKKQLLDVVERQLSRTPEAELKPEHLKCFSRDMFSEMIHQINAKGSQVSPALINLLKKMADTKEAQSSPDQIQGKDLSSKDMETLIKREEHEKYVPEDYDRLLKKAAEPSHLAEDTAESPFPVNEYLKTLTAEHLDFRICQFIFALMDEEYTEEGYLAYSKRLARSLTELLKAGQFPFLTTMMETLRRHAHEKPLENIRQQALSLLKSLSEKETIAKYVTPCLLRGMVSPHIITKFLVSSGAQNVPWLFDLYLDPTVPASTVITGIMKEFGKNATDEAVKRLDDQDLHTIIRLLTFLREMDDISVAPSLKNLFHHEEWAVRREVIKTLAQFDDPAVIELLRRSLKAENREEVLAAVSLSCRYRISDLLEDLTSMVKTIVISEENAILNEWIVGEVVKTGHPSVVPYLERIASHWVSLSPKRLSRMKVILYRNLGNFPKNQIMRLLKKGKKSRNGEIKTISAQILSNKE
jgi:hypothetical protein